MFREGMLWNVWMERVKSKYWSPRVESKILSLEVTFATAFSSISVWFCLKALSSACSTRLRNEDEVPLEERRQKWEERFKINSLMSGPNFVWEGLEEFSFVFLTCVSSDNWIRQDTHEWVEWELCIHLMKWRALWRPRESRSQIRKAIRDMRLPSLKSFAIQWSNQTFNYTTVFLLSPINRISFAKRNRRFIPLLAFGGNFQLCSTAVYLLLSSVCFFPD